MDGQDGQEKGMLRREILQNLITVVKFDAQISSFDVPQLR